MPSPVASILEEARAERGFPGATGAIVFADGETWTGAAGWSDPDADAPMREDAVMLQASVGKMYVGAVARRLEADGLLSLDAAVSDILAERPWFVRLANHEALTLRHLLNHSGGLTDYLATPGFQARVHELLEDPDKAFDPETLIGFTLDVPPLFPVGEGFAYSETAFLVAGLAIEAVTGRDYYDLVREMFLEPWRLTATYAADRRDIPGMATGFRGPNPIGLPRRSMEEGRLSLHPGTEWTGGGWASTSLDMAAFAQKLLGPAGAACRAEIVERGQPTQHPLPGVYGLGVLASESAYGRRFGHGGWTPGYRTDVHCYPEAGFSVAVMANTDDPAQLTGEQIVELGLKLAGRAAGRAPARDK